MEMLARFVMQGRLQALLMAGLFGVFSQYMLPLALLSAAIISIYVLRKSSSEWLFVLLGSIVMIYASSFFVDVRPGLEFPIILLILPVLLAASLVLRITRSQGLALCVIVICAALWAIAVELMTGNAVEWWTEWLKLAVTGVKGAEFQGFEQNNSIQFMNGLIAMMLAMVTIVSLLIARWLQSKLYFPGEFRKEFVSLTTPLSVLIIFVLTYLLAYVVSASLATDLLVVFMVLYFFQGLAVLHGTVGAMNASSAFLWPPYVLLVFVPQFVIVGLAAVGLVDLYFDFRKLKQGAQL